ncbi:MAG: LCP family protein [Oscillospiraceae bacterium]|nr:LCP family protein [Oscillospiraceae bacterium]
MKNKVLSTILFITVLVLLIAAEALTAAILLRLEMLPGKYVIVMIIALVLLAAAVGLLLFLPARGGKTGNVRRTIACVLALLMVCGCAVASKLAAEAYETIHSVTNPVPEMIPRDMYILVRIDDPAKSLADAVDYTFAYVENSNHDQTQQAIGELEAAFGKAPALAGYATSAATVDALLGGTTNAAIINGIHTTLLLDEEAYANLFDRVRILKTVHYVEPPETTVPETTVKQEDITNTPFAVYISGADNRNGINYAGRSDVNILMVVNPESKQILLINTPRDFYVSNSAGKGKKDKLTHLSIYGVECSMKALEELYDVEIEHYAKINFTGFEKLVDAVGGITVYSNEAFTTDYRKIKIKVGENKLNGKQALAFARERKKVSGGDRGRGKNQMKVIAAIVEKATTGTTIISNYSKIMNSLSGMFKTDLEKSDISKLVKMQLNDMATWNVQSYAVTGTGASEITYSMPGVKLYVMKPDQKTVDKAQDLIQMVYAGETISDEDVK